jgi:hypothetical protein
MVERFFRDITQNRLRRGVFRSVLELIDALDEYVDQHNDNPKPFIWTAKATDILARCCGPGPSLITVTLREALH